MASGKPISKIIIKQILHYRDDEHLTFVQIGKILGKDKDTIRRIYLKEKGRTK